MFLLTKKISIGKHHIPLPIILWFLLAAIAVSLELSRGPAAYNNYILYKHVFIHTLQQVNLYKGEPFHLFDNHYGPVFSILIAPFAALPNAIGCFLWCIANSWVLYIAIKMLPITHDKKMMILLIGVIELMTAIHNVQFNPMLTGWIILSFILVENKKDFWATLFIAAGFLIKLYGIVGLAFFMFSKQKWQFALSFIFWMIVLFCLPMFISSPSFQIQSYIDWFTELKIKNAKNTKIDTDFMQDISVMGMIRRIFKLPQLSNLVVLVPAALAYVYPLFRVNQISCIKYKLHYVALALIGVVLFSSSAESSTFIIAVTGVAIWYVTLNKPNKATIFLLILVLVLTSLSATDLFPAVIRNSFIKPYSLKALPCFLVWLVLVYNLHIKNYLIAS